MDIQKKRRALPEEVRTAASREISGLVAAHPLFLRAREIYCYASYGAEAATGDLFEMAWKLGKKVAVPRVTGAGRMEFYYIEDRKELRPGYQGIPEPAGEACKKAEREDALVILPGVVFDKKGNRIGYGKGFYDRYLRRHPDCRRLGIAFSMQCVDTIPAEPHDIRVEDIITEKGSFMVC